MMMKHPFNALAPLVSLIALAAAAGPALAQQVIALDEITFSANLTPTELARSGTSVAVVTRDDLDATGELQLSDVLARLPGVSVTQSGPQGTISNLRIRGAGPSYVAVYVDGVRVDDPSNPQVAFNFGHLTTADIGRVEVLRGSQSALYGGSAVGGVVNITTLGNDGADLPDGFGQTAAIEGGSFNTFSARYGLTFRDERLQAALNVSRIRSDGFSAWEGAVGDAATLDPDGFDSTRLSASLRYRVTDSFALGASAFVQSSDADYDGFGMDADNHEERREHGGRIFAEFDILGSTQTFSASAYRIDRRNIEPAGFAPLTEFEGRRVEFGWLGETVLSPDLTLLYGADTARETATIGGLGPDSTRVSGAFVQALWSGANGVDVSTAARVDHNSDFGTFTSGRLAVAWAATDALTLRGALARGFRAPSLSEQMGNPVWAIAANSELEPESSLSAELGADLHLGGVRLSATLFQLRINNAITYCDANTEQPWAPLCPNPVPAGFFNQYQNLAGTSTRRGIELGAEWALADAHDLAAAYTYTDARSPAGEQLANIPRHDLSLTLGSDWTDRLRSTATLVHVAGRSGGQPSFTVVNTALRYGVTDAVDLTLRVENLFDRQYQQVPQYATAGRSAYLGVSARF